MQDINLQLVAKDTKTYTFHLTRNNVPVDVSGWSIYFTVKNDFNDADDDALILKNVLLPNNADSIAGIGYLSLTSAETDIAVGEYYYDMKFIDTGYRESFLRGKFIIVPSIRTA